jgi:hypothetical protein
LASKLLLFRLVQSRVNKLNDAQYQGGEIREAHRHQTAISKIPENRKED